MPSLRPWFIALVADCLVLAASAAAFADCGCGPDCPCGQRCSCGKWIDPPPQNPDANTVRKNQSTLTAGERRAFIEAVKTLKRTFHGGSNISIYDQYVMAHMMAMNDLQVHDRTVFLPWHRALVRNFELELQAINPQVTVPYWDFTVDNQPDSALWSRDFMGGDGDPDANYAVQDGPFRQGEWALRFDGPNLRRRFGVFIPTLPTQHDVTAGMLVPSYDVPPWDTGSPVTESFRNYMAGWNFPSGEPEMHNRVHNWVGGSMLNMSSPNDPVFWLVHANLDRLWAEWEDLHGYDYPEEGPPPGQRLYDPMTPFGVTPADVLDHHALGYQYDTEAGD
jgi:tyrosinase